MKRERRTTMEVGVIIVFGYVLSGVIGAIAIDALIRWAA